jgi:hypothetical protein
MMLLLPPSPLPRRHIADAAAADVFVTPRDALSPAPRQRYASLPRCRSAAMPYETIRRRYERCAAREARRCARCCAAAPLIIAA